MSEPKPPSPPRGAIAGIWITVAVICLIVIAGSTFVTRAYLKRRDYEAENYRPPHLAKLERDLELTNRDGTEVSLSQLKDKVFVAGYQYTDCPAACLGMAAVMKDLHARFSTDPLFHLLSISVNPAGDTPEKMDAWVKEKGIDKANWWFVTGEPEAIRKYMLSQFFFFATEENTDPAVIAAKGQYAHDQRLALVDEGGNIRGYYDVLNLATGEQQTEKLIRDLQLVLEEARDE